MYKMLNHPSEWAKFFDERAGRYRYKHKGSGVVRDTLMAIGKAVKKGTTKVVKKAVQGAAEKAGKKLSEAVVEKGSDKIQQILRKRPPKTPPSKNKAPSQDAMIKLAQIFGEPALKLNQAKFFLINIRTTMFRTPRYLEKTDYIQFNLDTPLTFPGNGQHQRKSGQKFFVKDRDNVYDWYNAYFRVNFTFEALADGANVAGDTRSAPINSAFSLIKSMTVKSAGKTVYEADSLHNVIFIKNLLDYSDDYARSVAKSQFWYLDSDTTNVTAAANATNLGIRQRGLLSHGGLTVETLIPLNRSSFFEELSDRLLPPMDLEFEIVLQDDDKMIFQNDSTGRSIVVRKFELWVPQLKLTSEGQKLVNENFLKPTQWSYLKEVLHPSSSRGDASGSWLITAGAKNPKHVFVFFQQTRKQNFLEHNPYIFDTFDLDGDDSAKLSACRLQYGTSYLP